MEVQTTEKKKRTRAIPAYLICEELEGKPLYYKGYKDVLSGKKTKEDIMGASGLQMELISYLVRLASRCALAGRLVDAPCNECSRAAAASS
jgi:hypothetical protein